MKAIVLSIFILCSLFGNAQLKLGNYEQSSDTLDSFGNTFFSTLRIQSNGIFYYEHREGTCLLWYDKKGTWLQKGDTLVLAEIAECVNKMDEKHSELLPVETRFLIKGRSLLFQKQNMQTICFSPLEEIDRCSYTIKETATIKK